MDKPKVCIVILSWNGREDTLECLGSLSKITYPNYDVMVFDNGSTDGTFRAVKDAFPDVRVVRVEENLGFSGGNNIALQLVLADGGYDYVLLLNNDTVAEANFLDKMMLLALGLNSDCVGIRIHYYDYPGVIWYNGGSYNLHTCSVKHFDIGRVPTSEFQLGCGGGQFNFISACCMLISCYALRDVGLFDENIFIYGDDIDLCERLTRGGYSMSISYLGRVYHKVSRTQPLLKKWWRINKNWLYLARKYTEWYWRPVQVVCIVGRLPIQIFKFLIRKFLMWIHKKELQFNVRGTP